ncbi:hypothetical protein FCH79_07955 [Pseudomonas koreensis]|nr:hypothetical protein [Pseudomonas koreensis]
MGRVVVFINLSAGQEGDGWLSALSVSPGCISVSAVTAAYGFALTATHFFYKRLKKVSKKTLAPTFGPLAGARGPFAPGSIRAQRLRFASLHLLSLCLAAPNGRCAPTPGSIPPLSLPMSPVDQDQELQPSLRSSC